MLRVSLCNLGVDAWASVREFVDKIVSDAQAVHRRRDVGRPPASRGGLRKRFGGPGTAHPPTSAAIGRIIRAASVEARTTRSGHRGGSTHSQSRTPRYSSRRWQRGGRPEAVIRLTS